MKTGSSSLNPYAASYIPLSRRAAADENTDFNTAKRLQNGNETVRHGHELDHMLIPGQQQNISQSYVHSSVAFQTAEFTKWKHNHAGEFYASSSHYPNEIPEKSNFDQEFMDLTYLQIHFPGISEESLSEVYLANRCDLEATVDMLDQLELYADDSLDKLPDTLDIGDVPGAGSSSGLASEELRNLTAKAGTSTSGSSNLSSAN